MAYSELIKNFQRVRDYMREFYIYGFKSRDEFNKKSARSYDDERRRLESWLGEYMGFRQTSEGKNIFISIDSRLSNHNPLYKGWKTKSFTDGDITLHFILFDILSSPEILMSLGEITAEVDRILSVFAEPRCFDESTVRKKLKEYVSEGLITTEKKGKLLYYRRAADSKQYGTDCLDFFSEIAPCGVVGSYLLDKVDEHDKHFAFKHHYITSAIDSEIVFLLFQAMREKRNIIIETVNRHKPQTAENFVVPLRIFISVQSGRQYLLAYVPRYKRLTSYRIDHILAVKMMDECQAFDFWREKLKKAQSHMWGVSTQSTSGARMEYVEFTVTYRDDEKYIHRRLEREKRCGTVERVDANTSRFSAEVFDASELVPWIRSFICRIVDIQFSNKELERQFKDDLEQMYLMYDLGGAE